MKWKPGLHRGLKGMETIIIENQIDYKVGIKMETVIIENQTGKTVDNEKEIRTIWDL